MPSTMPEAQALPPSQRQSYTLSVQPVHKLNLSGSDFPSPLDSPPVSPLESPPVNTRSSCLRLSRPPTSGGGPLTSHPSYDCIRSIASPLTAPSEPDLSKPTNHSIDPSPSDHRPRADSVQSVHSPSSPNNMDHSPHHQRPHTVRRLFSLSSLRQSFSSSRTSLSRPDTAQGSYQYQRPESPGAMSMAAPSVTPSSAVFPHHHSQAHTHVHAHVQRPATSLRKKRSSNWFNKRKSTLFGAQEDTQADGTLDVLSEDGPEHKKFKDNQLLVLPEIGSLSGGRLDGGNLGWDDKLFRD